MTIREAHSILSRRIGDPVAILPADATLADGTRFSALMRNEMLYSAMTRILNSFVQRTDAGYAAIATSPFTKNKLMFDALSSMFPRLSSSVRCSDITTTGQQVYTVTFQATNTTVSTGQATFANKGTEIVYPYSFTIESGTGDNANQDLSSLYKVPIISVSHFTSLVGSYLSSGSIVARPSPVAMLQHMDINDGTGVKNYRFQLFDESKDYRNKRIFLHYLRMPLVPAIEVSADLDKSLDFDAAYHDAVLNYASLYADIEGQEYDEKQHIWQLLLG